MNWNLFNKEKKSLIHAHYTHIHRRRYHLAPSNKFQRRMSAAKCAKKSQNKNCFICVAQPIFGSREMFWIRFWKLSVRCHGTHAVNNQCIKIYIDSIGNKLSRVTRYRHKIVLTKFRYRNNPIIWNQIQSQSLMESLP